VDHARLRAATPKMSNVMGALFYQQWYEDRTADETLALAFGQRDDAYRARVIQEVDALFERLPSEQEARDYVASFNVDVDFDRDFPSGVRDWLAGARVVLAEL
jgi:hypothetical protein